MLRAVLFDMDDTLLDWSNREGHWLEIAQRHLRPIHEYLQNEGHALPELPEMVRAYGEQARLIWEGARPPEWVCPRQVDLLRGMLVNIELNTEKIDLARVEKLFAWGPIPGVRPYDDALPVLRSLRKAGLKTGLVTNAAMPMWMRDSELKEMGLLDHLDVRLTAGDVGRLKPHPHPFNVALERLGVTPEEAVMVGDRVQDDVAGAQAAGMRAVWVRRRDDNGNGSIKPNAIIHSLAELLDTLDLWYPGWRKKKQTSQSVTA